MLQEAQSNHSDIDDDQAACLLVFNDCADGVKNKRRTAGESVTAEGSLRQPCDVAYWRRRASQPQRQHIPSSRFPSTTLHSEKEWADAAALAEARTNEWFLEPPPWYKRFNDQDEPNDDTNRSRSHHDEETLRMRLMCPGSEGITKTRQGSAGRARHVLDEPLGYNNNLLSSVGAKRGRDVSRGMGGRTGAQGWGNGGSGAVRDPEAGAFVVRETGVAGVLQLLYVVSTQVQSNARGFER